MLDYAREKLRERKDIAWRQANAVKLPFGDTGFGAVVCAFGFMFVPDKRTAFREAYRVLQKGGILLFNVWDRIEENSHAAINAQILEDLFPGDEEMRFRVPHEMHSPSLLEQLLTQAGFRKVQIDKRRLPVDRVSARTIAIGQCRGTPRYLLIEKRGVSVDLVIDKVTDALARIGGADPYRGVAQALVVQARR